MLQMLVADGDAKARQIVVKLQEAILIGIRIAFEDVIEQLVPHLDIEDREYSEIGQFILAMVRW